MDCEPSNAKSLSSEVQVGLLKKYIHGHQQLAELVNISISEA